MQLGNILTDEIRDHIDFYRSFLVSGEDDIETAIRKYLLDKQYNNNICDMFISALCSAMCMKVNIFRFLNDALFEIIVIPCRPMIEVKRSIYLTLENSDLLAHYDAATGDTKEGSEDFNPEVIKPHPKAPQRKSELSKRKRRKSTILTNSPEMKSLREEQESKKCNQETTRKNKSLKKAKLGKPLSFQNKKQEKRIEDWHCLLCNESWSNTRPNDK